MAHIRKITTGYKAEIDRKGVRKSKTFPTKARAVSWAAREEASILDGSSGQYPSKTLAEALDEYEKKVSRKKRGSRAEAMRLSAIKRDFPILCAMVMHKIEPSHIAQWRDARREKVSDSSVVREAATLRNVWTVASNEWGWCGESPWKKVKLPAKSHARTRRTKWQEMKRVLRHMGYVTGKPPQTMQCEVAWAWLVAHHTAMRAGEVRSLSMSTVRAC